ncbi:MAG: MoxR family ATPase [Candidatus Marinimicrobia bacterium]|jgi:MoxR-like ATPase|nr:MoxR family ATPase [Candidatus Neomarinimicrobiota bacterium]MDP6852975.1 MoxR family ATPase [Candidatus Neomarinimicrobiota bacterium]MDP6936628.1 MoxR family ATPase [Candidatus Neomarinimicrobiota bacterium]
MDNIQLVEKLQADKETLFQEISKVIIGQTEIIEHLFISLLCRGHILLEGVPGLAKTLLIKTLSDALDLSFNRIQFTPDLMPSDITGTEIIEEEHGTGKRSFKFFKGPVFANIVLADEINRTPPKTQAALLEAMQEHKVTAGGETYTLEEPFFVLATQNPIEQEGTYPLPEAQLDRFMFNILISYPSRNEEVEIVKSTTGIGTDSAKPVLKAEDLFAYQELVRNVPVADNVIEYAVDFVNHTRTTGNGSVTSQAKDWLEWGAGPRASMYLILAAKARAVLDGRTTPDIADVQAMLNPVLRHRIIPNFNAEADGITRDNILSELLTAV